MKLFRRDPDPFAASRFDGIVRSRRDRERQHMKHWWSWALLGLFLILLVTALYALWKYNWLEDKIKKDLSEVAETDEAKPFNALLVGSDSREGLTEQEQLDLGANAVGGERADTIILAHVDPPNNAVTMVQFPRDLYVPLPGKGSEKINAALAYGPNYLVKTIKALTGLEINKYVQVNIAGFRDIVDAIDGVDLCITEPIPFDPKTGLVITQDELGIVHFDGERALRFVRSRNFLTGDFERIKNQQRFVAAAINKVTSGQTFSEPWRLNRLADVAADYVTTDSHTSIRELRDLAKRLREFDPERYEAYVAPNLGIGASDDGQSIVVPDMPAMRLLFEAMRNNKSPAEYDGVPDVEPSTIKVGVYNGTGEDGLAASAQATLEKVTDIGAGPIDVIEIGEAPRRALYRKTIVFHDADKPETEQMAELVAAAIPGSVIKEGKVRGEMDVAVIVGQRFSTRKLIQILPIQLPKPTAAPDICKR